MSNTNNIKANVAFAAIDKRLETSIVAPTEKVLPGRDYIEWGEGNRYPDYLMSLYKASTTLHSVVRGSVDYIKGDEVRSARESVNASGESMASLIGKLAQDYFVFGGFALQVIRNRNGEPGELYHIDMRYLRTNKRQDVFWYCEDWCRYRKSKAVVYPLYLPMLDWTSLDEEGRALHATGIVYVKSEHSQVYPMPLYGAHSAIIACELERKIGTFHINNVNNGFASSMIVNFNNGIPTDEVRQEIEDDFNEKFSGAENGGRIMLSWNDNKENAATIETPKLEDFSARYDSLSKYCRQQIFTSFHATPNIFGIPTESLGFSQEEYEQAFTLFNRTQIQPVQQLLVDTINRIYQSDVVSITPFTLAVSGAHNID